MRSLVWKMVHIALNRGLLGLVVKKDVLDVAIKNETKSIEGFRSNGFSVFHTLDCIGGDAVLEYEGILSYRRLTFR